ncbi:DUF2865 domain-containing protein [Kumtagia ephedrae]|uniref:DUF2865 domain-containing protein n=1 Tax=Kumtagia ephedrae TaxID=2116701 RepID=A0A2P7SSZ5_9HYPH|nr:DUF2865 domain-containing protein [Mesorhizobium ephedrae]PSJ65567.1 hypothetical protein C7I84_00040 [Mesorhizobium ephedrae]
MKASHIRFWALVLAFLTLFAPADPVNAAARICRQLEAELAGGVAKSPARVRKYDAAIVRQREQMAVARAQARDAGCGFALAGRAVRQCAVINATLQRMADNLETLQRQRGQLAGGKRSRASLLAALNANGCRGGGNDEGDRGGMRTAADPEKAPDRRPAEAPARVPDKTAGGPGYALLGAPPAERFRTMCVRVCDGYFFPMSQSSSIGDFDRDVRNCRSSCPGAETQLFYGPPEAEGAADMLSTATGRAYQALPTAFLHQNMSESRTPGCGCKANRSFEVVAGGAGNQRLAVPPAPAPAGIEKPRSGEASASIVAIPAPPQAARPAGPAAPPMAPAHGTERPLEDRKVRVVGPAFLPDPEAAGDPPAPVPPRVR